MTNTLQKQIRALINAARTTGHLPCDKASAALYTVLRVAAREVLGPNTAQATLSRIASAWVKAAVSGQDAPCFLPKPDGPKPAAKPAPKKSAPQKKSKGVLAVTNKKRLTKSAAKPAKKLAKKGAKK